MDIQSALLVKFVFFKLIALNKSTRNLMFIFKKPSDYQ